MRSTVTIDDKYKPIIEKMYGGMSLARSFKIIIEGAISKSALLSMEGSQDDFMTHKELYEQRSLRSSL
jgi:hypothetical protein